MCFTTVGYKMRNHRKAKFPVQSKTDGLKKTIRTSPLMQHPFKPPFKRVAVRNLQPELMDDPALPKLQHDHALRGLTTIHRFSGLVNRFWKRLQPLLKKISQQNRQIKIADVGCGDGYLLRQLARKSAAAGFNIQWTGYDFSEVACSLAAEKARTVDVAIRFEVLDILANEIPEQYDIILNSLFLHHFEAGDVQTILTRFRDATTQGFIVEDLRRTVLGYALAWAGGRLLTRSPIVHYDGVVSVEGSFSIPEIQKVLAAADIQQVEITKHWPQRFVLTFRH